MFLRDGLSCTIESSLFRQTFAVPTLRAKPRRPHYPLENPSALRDLCARINSTRGPNAAPDQPTDYRRWLVFMALSGLRPTEFFRGLWQLHEPTQHLFVRGTKTANAVRLIPNVFWLDPLTRSETALLQRFDAVCDTFPFRARDLRRTYSIWLEEAQVPRSRIAYYLGHAPRDMTSLYQRREPSRDDLTIDAQRLLQWFTSYVSIDACINA
jgi:integrase